MSDTKIQREKDVMFRYRKPSDYNVLFHNDDVTTMEFVVYVLESIFHKTPADAEMIMLKVHNEGKAVVGTYNRDIAESKAKKTTNLARANGYPLLVTIEEV